MRLPETGCKSIASDTPGLPLYWRTMMAVKRRLSTVTAAAANPFQNSGLAGPPAPSMGLARSRKVHAAVISSGPEPTDMLQVIQVLADGPANQAVTAGKPVVVPESGMCRGSTCRSIRPEPLFPEHKQPASRQSPKCSMPEFNMTPQQDRRACLCDASQKAWRT